MVPEVSGTQRCVNPSLLPLDAFSADELIKVVFERLSQQANIWMNFCFPAGVDIVNVRYTDLLTSQLSYDFGTVILLSRRNTGWSC